MRMASTVSAVSFATSPICMVLVARSETWGMLKGYTLEYGPESRAFSEMSLVTSDGIILLSVFSVANSKTRHIPACPTDSNCHNRLDDRGGGCATQKFCPDPIL